MFMRFRGGGIGHKALRPIEDLLDSANIESPEVASNSENAANTTMEELVQSDEDEDKEGEFDDERELPGSDEEALGPEDGEDEEDLEENPAY